MIKKIFLALLIGIAGIAHGATAHETAVAEAVAKYEAWMADDKAPFLPVYDAYRKCISTALDLGTKAKWCFNLAVLAEESGDKAEALRLFKGASLCGQKASLQTGKEKTDGITYKDMADAEIARLSK